jgi:hypothetical protein
MRILRKQETVIGEPPFERRDLVLLEQVLREAQGGVHAGPQLDDLLTYVERRLAGTAETMAERRQRLEAEHGHVVATGWPEAWFAAANPDARRPTVGW